MNIFKFTKFEEGSLKNMKLNYETINKFTIILLTVRSKYHAEIDLKYYKGKQSFL